jgi:hypothetical protein
MPPFRQWVNVTKTQYTFDNATNQSVAWNETIAQRLVGSSAELRIRCHFIWSGHHADWHPNWPGSDDYPSHQNRFLKQNGQDFKKTYRTAIYLI